MTTTAAFVCCKKAYLQNPANSSCTLFRQFSDHKLSTHRKRKHFFLERWLQHRQLRTTLYIILFHRILSGRDICCLSQKWNWTGNKLYSRAGLIVSALFSFLLLYIILLWLIFVCCGDTLLFRLCVSVLISAYSMVSASIQNMFLLQWLFHFQLRFFFFFLVLFISEWKKTLFLWTNVILGPFSRTYTYFTVAVKRKYLVTVSDPEMHN